LDRAGTQRGNAEQYMERPEESGLVEWSER
jgi:hypothetical protein